MYLDLLRLTAGVAVVTGGGRAVGVACAGALGEAGARVAIADRDRQGLAASPAMTVPRTRPPWRSSSATPRAS